MIYFYLQDNNKTINIQNRIKPMEHLTCLLCSHPYHTPKMCPTCSTVFCNSCIVTYLAQHHFCPSCDTYILELVDCGRLLEEVKERIGNVNRSVTNANSNSKKMCISHHLQLKYYCQQCKRKICADCGMIDQTHKNHTISASSPQVSNISKLKLRQYTLLLSQYLLSLKTTLQQQTLTRELLSSSFKFHRHQLQQYYNRLIKSLQDQYNQSLQQIQKEVTDSFNKIQKVKKIKEDLEQIGLIEASITQIANNVSRNNTFKQILSRGDIDQFYMSIQEEIMQNGNGSSILPLIPKELTTLQHIFPQYINHTFEFEPSTSPSLLYSQTYSIFGHQFRLKIYPRGTAQCQNYLGVFVELMTLPGTGIAQYFHYRLEVLCINEGSRTISKEYCSPFMEGECWGYRQFIPLSDVDNFLTADGKLIIVIGIKWRDYYQMWKGVSSYIKTLQSQKIVLESIVGHGSQLHQNRDVQRDQILQLESRLRIDFDQSSVIIDSD